MKVLNRNDLNEKFFNKDYELEKDILVKGFVCSCREMSWGSFFVIRNCNETIQCVVTHDIAHNIVPESYVEVKGLFTPASLKNKLLTIQDREIRVSEFRVINSPVSALPIDLSKNELSLNLDTSLDLRELSLRHSFNRAVFKIQSIVSSSFTEYLEDQGFTKVHTPKISPQAVESGSSVFSLDYFGKKACLAQSPQLYKQMMVPVFDRVFEVGPVFRAEKHSTSRHLNEYISLDVEMTLENDFYDLIYLEVRVLEFIFNNLKKKCSKELIILDVELPKIESVVIMSFEEVHDIVWSVYGKDYRSELDLAPEEEKLICEYVKEKYSTDFVFVSHYPIETRPFYTKADKIRPDTSLSFDLLFRGVEITTGGQRLDKYEDYIERLEKSGISSESLENYLNTFKFSTSQHGGFGLGLERLVSKICGLKNIKEASLFPRDCNRITP
ncbi:aspartate--tRNA(Asn) ligase [Vibrio alginolyticus]|uniref:aspartate--tRNA(Asn) ligase n=1 Tax=Vibrio alginolyticus TaxID=663 RepID=UPI00215F6673|nr:aspartate--tRNA(Asn) ligase [Vibrio alginolyticus]MCS0160644.1 aspartate--tRNA(Asn) ligase [Vibrio alginolyticus]MCS0211199.1 aspartate--tRNA(Asn) ligase [Vibrio alginolyticus]